MKISARGQQALATMAYLAIQHEEQKLIAGPAIADFLGVSKIYLEQTLALLKRAYLVSAIKGAQGGYRLSRNARKITVAEILLVAEPGLFDMPPPPGPEIPALLHVLDDQIYQPLDRSVRSLLKGMLLQDLADAYGRLKTDAGFMFYI
ncbi:MAG: Rrf2 family transcriptional regulator [Bacillota bacterium]|nr:Rrf2 family transcriptional regulator [Bacillota bacterium]